MRVDYLEMGESGYAQPSFHSLSTQLAEYFETKSEREREREKKGKKKF